MGQENFVSETVARLGAAPPDRVPEEDYRSFSEALGASARGRAFLHEYARRNRHADTEVVLAALSKLEQTARAHQSAPEAERIRQDLRALLETVRGAKPQIDNSPGAIKAATLAAMLEFVQARLEALVSPRTTLEQVPAPEQPELPIPQPAPMPTVLALVQAAMAAPPPPRTLPFAAAPEGGPAVTAFKPETTPQPRSSEIIPEVSFFETAAAQTTPEPAAPTQAAAPATKAAPAKPEVEPYELWLDPGLAARPKPETKPAQPAIDARAEAAPTANPAAETAVNLPAGAPSAPPPRPATALAALAASFANPPEATPAIRPVTVKLPPVTHPAAGQTQSAPPKSSDPLALIMALSEAERLALFT